MCYRATNSCNRILERVDQYRQGFLRVCSDLAKFHCCCYSILGIRRFQFCYPASDELLELGLVNCGTGKPSELITNPSGHSLVFALVLRQNLIRL